MGSVRFSFLRLFVFVATPNLLGPISAKHVRTKNNPPSFLGPLTTKQKAAPLFYLPSPFASSGTSPPPSSPDEEESKTTTAKEEEEDEEMRRRRRWLTEKLVTEGGGRGQIGLQEGGAGGPRRRRRSGRRHQLAERYRVPFRGSGEGRTEVVKVLFKLRGKRNLSKAPSAFDKRAKTFFLARCRKQGNPWPRPLTWPGDSIAPGLTWYGNDPKMRLQINKSWSYLSAHLWRERLAGPSRGRPPPPGRVGGLPRPARLRLRTRRRAQGRKPMR